MTVSVDYTQWDAFLLTSDPTHANSVGSVSITYYVSVNIVNCQLCNTAAAATTASFTLHPAACSAENA
jgi:hypothetical protein